MTLPHNVILSVAMIKYVCVSGSVVSNSLQFHGLYVTSQAPLSMGFSRPEYWGGLPFPSPGNLPDPGIKPRSPMVLALAGRFFMF